MNDATEFKVDGRSGQHAGNLPTLRWLQKSCFSGTLTQVHELTAPSHPLGPTSSRVDRNRQQARVRLTTQDAGRITISSMTQHVERLPRPGGARLETEAAAEWMTVHLCQLQEVPGQSVHWRIRPQRLRTIRTVIPPCPKRDVWRRECGFPNWPAGVLLEKPRSLSLKLWNCLRGE